MDRVAFFQKQLRQVRAVLAGDAGKERRLRILIHRRGIPQTQFIEAALSHKNERIASSVAAVSDRRRTQTQNDSAVRDRRYCFAIFSGMHYIGASEAAKFFDRNYVPRRSRYFIGPTSCAARILQRRHRLLPDLGHRMANPGDGANAG